MTRNFGFKVLSPPEKPQQLCFMLFLVNLAETRTTRPIEKTGSPLSVVLLRIIES